MGAFFCRTRHTTPRGEAKKRRSPRCREAGSSCQQGDRLFFVTPVTRIRAKPAKQNVRCSRIFLSSAHYLTEYLCLFINLNSFFLRNFASQSDNIHNTIFVCLH